MRDYLLSNIEECVITICNMCRMARKYACKLNSSIS